MIVCGLNPVKEALQAEICRVTRVLVTRGKSNHRLQTIIDAARAASVPLQFETRATLTSKAKTIQHQDVVADLAALPYTPWEDLKQSLPSRLLLLDGVEDPHNLGAVLRTAEAVGVGGVLLPRRRSCGLTPAVLKSSAGAAFHLPVARIGNVAQTLRQLKQMGYWIVGLDMKGKDLARDLPLNERLAISVGGENQGLRRVVRCHCDFLISIPMRGRISSLNLSVAAGIFLYQLLPSQAGRLPDR